MRAYKKILFLVTPYLLPKAKANLFIIGGQKCGTSSLFRTLSTHKYINPSLFKEAHFFEKNYAYTQNALYRHTLSTFLSLVYEHLG